MKLNVLFLYAVILCQSLWAGCGDFRGCHDAARDRDIINGLEILASLGGSNCFFDSSRFSSGLRNQFGLSRQISPNDLLALAVASGRVRLSSMHSRHADELIAEIVALHQLEACNGIRAVNSPVIFPATNGNNPIVIAANDPFAFRRNFDANVLANQALADVVNTELALNLGRHFKFDDQGRRFVRHRGHRRISRGVRRAARRLFRGPRRISRFLGRLLGFRR